MNRHVAEILDIVAGTGDLDGGPESTVIVLAE
jgi:hypothetical protein